MGHIKEPEGIDFTIKSEPLTNDERAAISEFIRQYKDKSVDVKKGTAELIANKSIAVSETKR